MTGRLVSAVLVLALSTVAAVGAIAGGPLASTSDRTTTELVDRVEDASDQPESRQRVLDTARSSIEAYPAGEGGLGGAAGPMLGKARANLETIEAMTAIADAEDRSALQRALEAASEMGGHQARILGVPGPSAQQQPAFAHARPSEAVAALAAGTDTPLTPEQQTRARLLDELAAPLAQALTRLVDAHLATTEATERAIALLADGPPADDRRTAQLPLADRETATEAAHALADLLAARRAFLRATLDLDEALAVTPLDEVPASASLAVPPAFAFDLAGTDDVHEEDVRLLVDVGGDDTYRNNAGGSDVGVECQSSGILGLPMPVERAPSTAASVDLGGEDRYVSGEDCGVNGGGHFGAGLLVDHGGSDEYRAGDGGTNGGGRLFGLGLLVDSVGDDTYDGGDGGVNGGGDGTGFTGHGVGLLVDGSGEDRYEAGSSGTNGGGWDFSAGALVDLAGSDVYTGGRFSVNGGGWIGTGFLADLGGEDRYLAGDEFGTVGVNAGAQFGVGFLYDDGGDDVYRAESDATFSPAENGGVAGGVGFLLDAEGHDTYVATHAGANAGVGMGGGLAVLADGSGDDTYDASRAPTATNGGVRTHQGGHGVLADAEGNDTYLASGKAANGGAVVESREDLGEPATTGLLFDGGGNDRYSDARVDCNDCTELPKGLVGAQVDR